MNLTNVLLVILPYLSLMLGGTLGFLYLTIMFQKKLSKDHNKFLKGATGTVYFTCIIVMVFSVFNSPLTRPTTEVHNKQTEVSTLRSQELPPGGPPELEDHSFKGQVVEIEDNVFLEKVVKENLQ